MTEEYVATVVGIDPGEHMGVCVLDLYRDDRGTLDELWPPLRGHKIVVREFCTVDGEQNIIEYLDQLLTTLPRKYVRPNIYVTCEHFVFTRTSSMGGSRAAVEMTGALKALFRLQTNKRDPKVRWNYDDTQKPADAKLIDNKALTDLGIKARGDGSTDHAHMAAKHAVVKATKISKLKNIRKR